MLYVRRWILVSVVLAVPIALFFFILVTDESLFVFSVGDIQKETIQIGDVPVRVEIAETEAKRVKGLSGRDSLSDNTGMLFVFEEDGYYGIWMKNMNFPIDVIWISHDNVIVDIRRDVTPDTFPEVFRPKVEARYILEVPVNFAEIYGIRVGTPVFLGSASKT